MRSLDVFFKIEFFKVQFTQPAGWFDCKLYHSFEIDLLLYFVQRVTEILGWRFIKKKKMDKEDM